MLTRDSRLWNILMAFGLAIATTLIVADNPADYGLSPVMFKWVQLAAMGLVAIGKLGNSPLQGAEEKRADDRRQAREDARDAGRG